MALHDAGFFQMTQSLGQQVGGDSGQSGLKSPVTGRTHKQLSHDEQAPPITDDIERTRQSAVLAIGTGAHRVIASASKFEPGT
ncbi:hypothetical protein MAGR_60770 [Mycolicibacterium agri]|uniref:Uncharacterized protein n=1 Tax=Mycolicibacterium agri TaxID=36811 RepID=A0A7I9WBQ0_MYCAG|nr:hypothetical protein MAGR_60770 [Mycolicibacterium agri]